MNSLTVFFDVGHTLIDSPELIETITRKLSNDSLDNEVYDLVSEALYGNGRGLLYRYKGLIDEDKEERYAFISIENMYASAFAYLAKKYGYRDISGEAHSFYLDVALHQTRLYPETISVLEKLLRNRVQMIIASDEDTEIMEKKLAKYDLNKYFVDKCISGSVRAYKPANKFICHLKKYTTNNEVNCYFVGDSPGDVECGRRLGIKSVLIDRKNTGNEIGTDYVIHDLNELLPMLNLK